MSAGRTALDATEAHARALDAEDPLAGLRERFHLPRGDDGTPRAYLCGNSLGLAPVAARAAVERELDDWARLGVDGHFHAASPWYRYHERLRDSLARLAGAEPSEVVAMNSLTVNLHLMLTSFYRPAGPRHRMLVEEHAFPSDRYAVESQLGSTATIPQTRWSRPKTSRRASSAKASRSPSCWSVR